MDLFPDGAHVRLRSRELGTYIHADEDGVGVSLSPRRASLNTAWVVHRIMSDGVSYVLLHGAAYGRYLALSPHKAPPGHRGHRVVQSDRDDFDPQPRAFMWRAIRAWDDGGGDDVIVRHDHQRNLRANGRYRHWLTGVTVDKTLAKRSTMMRWTVQAIPPREAPPDIRLPVATPKNVGTWRGLFRRRAVPASEPRRTIWYVRADDYGNINPLNWVDFNFFGRSVFNLRTQVAFREGANMDGVAVDHFVLCLKAGNEARLTPLVIDLLPSNQNPMYIVALTNGSPAAGVLLYPDVDAEAPDADAQAQAP